jgi:serine/threonine protein kinase
MPDAATHSATDRNLLFGVLALQMDFLTRDELIAAMQAWVLDKDQPLGAILERRGALAADERAALDALVAKHTERHGGDPRRSLAAAGTGVAADVHATLALLPDPDVQASLVCLALNGDASSGAPLVGLDSDTCTATDSTVEVERNAGDARFRPLRLLDRGGLGEVFVALDGELNREVALKLVRGERADDQRSRARFVVEAEITGNLEHPGVVPVYSLGRRGDGRPFYAMRLIQGETLRQAIERYHDAAAPRRDAGARALELRRLLGGFVGVCNTVAYAHSRGVLHRDLKPSNIMLGKYGEALVVDWGLAKSVGRPDPHADGDDERTLRPGSGSTAQMTVAGSRVGTPGYMSPEQAAGRLDRVGPASDVYSLGATLYTILAGRGPFAECGLPELLRRVERGDFPRPRAVCPSADPALEAVCLKAMALRPEDRYATAKDLAAEVENWLADEPVVAYREPPTARLRRWARRHRTLVASLLILGGTLTAALGVGAAVFRAKQVEAEAAHREALENFELARQAIDDYARRVADDLRLNQNDLRGLRAKLLDEVVPFYERLIDRYGARPELRLQQARATLRLAQVRSDLGDVAGARPLLERALADLRALASGRPEFEADLAEAHGRLGEALVRLGETDTGIARIREGAALYARVADRAPDDPRPHIRLALLHRILGVAHRGAGRGREAETEYRAARSLFEGLARRDPGDAAIARELAAIHRDLALLLDHHGRRDEARAELRRALDESRRQARIDPSLAAIHEQPDFRRTWAALSDAGFPADPFAR